MRNLLLTVSTAIIGVVTIFASSANACSKPKPGTYWLGWGGSRLIVPNAGRPYQTFRTERVNLPGKYCQSADSVGVIRIESNGKIWGYTPSPD